MLIGIDFDNTIVRYDRVFHVAATELGLIGETVPATKLAVRDALRAAGREDAWTELQGYVYGRRLLDAEAFDGVLDFLRQAKACGHRCAIISHKTRYPYMGPRYDLHAAAQDWIHTYLVEGGNCLLAPDEISFHETKQEKIARIAAAGCTAFIDDLPEILDAEGFPKSVRAILFDPDDHHRQSRHQRVSGWPAIQAMLCS